MTGEGPARHITSGEQLIVDRIRAAPVDELRPGLSIPTPRPDAGTPHSE